MGFVTWFAVVGSLLWAGYLHQYVMLPYLRKNGVKTRESWWVVLNLSDDYKAFCRLLVQQGRVDDLRLIRSQMRIVVWVIAISVVVAVIL